MNKHITKRLISHRKLAAEKLNIELGSPPQLDFVWPLGTMLPPQACGRLGRLSLCCIMYTEAAADSLHVFCAKMIWSLEGEINRKGSLGTKSTGENNLDCFDQWQPCWKCFQGSSLESLNLPVNPVALPFPHSLIRGTAALLSHYISS